MSELTEYFLRHYTLVLDNDQGTYNATQRAAREVLRGADITLSQYRAMSGTERAERFADKIGEGIMSLVNEYLTDTVPDSQADVGATLIHECMFMEGSSTELEWALGKHYMPEDDDVDGVLDDEDGA